MSKFVIVKEELRSRVFCCVEPSKGMLEGLHTRLFHAKTMFKLQLRNLLVCRQEKNSTRLLPQITVHYWIYISKCQVFGGIKTRGTPGY